MWNELLMRNDELINWNLIILNIILMLLSNVTNSISKEKFYNEKKINAVEIKINKL